MGDCCSNNRRFDLQLMINILLEERLIDSFAAFELQKKNDISSFEDLVEAIHVDVKKRRDIDIKQIYDIIAKEQIIPGNYHLVTVKTIAKLKSLFRKWHSPVSGQMKISDVLKDIRYKAITLSQGEFFYFNGKATEPLSKGRYAYKLLIKNRLVFFIDLHNKIAYHIVWGEKDNDKLCNL